MAYKVISADGHVEAHPNLWHQRIPAKYLDRVPRYRKEPNGREVWVVGSHTTTIGVETTTSGLPYDKLTVEHTGYYTKDGGFRPGLGDGTQRARELAHDGVDCEVLYPPVFGPNFLKHMLTDGDKDAYMAVVQGYNTWLQKDYVAAAPDRLIGTAILPETGVDDAVAEMKRCVEMGLTSMCLNSFPNGGDDPSPDDDKFWAASLDLNAKMTPHQNFGRGQQTTSPNKNPFFDMGSRSRIIGRPTKTIGNLISTGVLDRFPKLKFYFAEADMGWIPFHLASSDDWFLRFYHERNTRLPRLPSQYWRDHMRFCFLYDPAALQQRYNIGLDLIMWGSDLPHSTGSWPHSREVLDVLFRDIPEEEKHQILVTNVCEYFDLDPEKELTPVP
jgi:predicted TIM-barrel fold metal-dependent hydrolase